MELQGRHGEYRCGEAGLGTELIGKAGVERRCLDGKELAWNGKAGMESIGAARRGVAGMESKGATRNGRE